MKFDQANYWKKRGKTYYNTFLNEKEMFEHYKKQEKFFVEVMNKEFDQNISSVLEVGAGFGRMTEIMCNLFANIKDYKCIDISSEQIENAKKYLSSKKLTFRPEFINKNFLEYNDSIKYDIVFASEVFYHFPSEMIKDALDKACSLSSKYLVLLDIYPGVIPLNWKNIIKKNLNSIIGKIKPLSWQFEHNYISLLDEELVDYIKIYPNKETKHCVYVIKLKEN